jgi:hypothetical protein
VKVTNDCFLTIPIIQVADCKRKGQELRKKCAYLHKTCAETTIAYPRERLKFQQKARLCNRSENAAVKVTIHVQKQRRSFLAE